MKNISILGSTGSIGKQTLEVADKCNLRVLGLSANSNIELLEEQIRRYNPRIVCVTDEKKADVLAERVKDTSARIVTGTDGLCEVATIDDAEIVVTSIVGIAGLVPTIAAINAGKNIALANKETLVTAGEIIMPLAQEKGVKILPVDSEHGAIFQALNGEDYNKIKKIILTASGGPFFGKKRDELTHFTKENALKHPNWSMGAKITIDSATLMNKGLEVIEAKWLFGVDAKDIEVVVHRQSIVHSAVEFVDNSIIAQMGTPDMRLPISYAINYPDRVPSPAESLDFSKMLTLTFEKPDMETFKCLALAFRAIEIGGTMPAVLNGANEAAVELFLQDKIGFLDIADLVEGAMNNHKVYTDVTLENILKSDIEAREYVKANSHRVFPR